MNQLIPNTDDDRKAMLDAIGVKSAEELFSNIPEEVLLQDSVPLGKSKAEEDVLRRVRSLASRNVKGVCFLGAGSYDHLIPSAVKSISSLPSFVTAYTPYQPEISQGILQSIYEYQSMICNLTGMDVSNASLYDGASAAAEAAALAISNRRKSDTIVLSSTMHPFAISCVKTWAMGRGDKVVMLPEDGGITDFGALEQVLDDKTAVVLVQTPNRYGILEDLSGVAAVVHEAGALFAVSSDPMSLAMQKSQREWGADIAIGDTQPLGLPMGFGGPGCGYMAVTDALMRKIPGRIVGRTVDNQGRTSYVLTLQAREQHIKRERATSNICSNEALMALTSAVYLSTVGWNGLKEAASQSYQKAHWLASLLSEIEGVSLLHPEKSFWCEFALKFDDPRKMRMAMSDLKSCGIFGGVKLEYITRDSKDEGVLLVAVTEKRTREEIEAYVSAVRRVMQ